MGHIVRWGILGVAGINERMIRPLQTAKRSQLRAIASRSLEKAQASATRHGIPNAFGSYEELLADPNIDAVYIPLPNHMHDEWTRKAADQGKHVLCEKPLTCDARSAAELVSYCRGKNVRLLEGFMWPHHPRTQRLRDFLDSGAIGTVRKVNASFSFNLVGLPKDNIRMQPEAGGGALLDVGCYTTYAIRWWMQAEPVSVFARAAYENGVDVAMAGVFTFADGRTANFDCSFTHPLRTWVEIVGTNAVVRIPNMWIPDERAAFQVIRQVGDFGYNIEEIETPGANQMVNMVEAMVDAIGEGRDPNPSPDEAVRTLRVINALAVSAKENREVTL